MLRVVISKAAEIRLTIFPATWLKLYTDLLLRSGGFSAVFGAALAPPQVLILIALALLDALKVPALKNKTFRSLWTVAERETPGLKEIDETSYRKDLKY
jgi:hypothetical protein